VFGSQGVAKIVIVNKENDIKDAISAGSSYSFRVPGGNSPLNPVDKLLFLLFIIPLVPLRSSCSGLLILGGVGAKLTLLALLLCLLPRLASGEAGVSVISDGNGVLTTGLS